MNNSPNPSETPYFFRPPAESSVDPFADGQLLEYVGPLPAPGTEDLYGFGNPRRLRVTLDCGEESVTKQEFKDECDIQNILRQFSRTGIIEHINAQEAQWLDLPDMTDFQQSLAVIEEAEAAFNSLPSLVREKYDNDPAKFLGALNDPAQEEYLREVGILAPKWAKAAGEAPAVVPAAGAAGGSAGGT